MSCPCFRDVASTFPAISRRTSSAPGSQPLAGLSTPGQGQGEGPDGDKWSQTTQYTLGGAGANEVSGVPPGAGLPGAEETDGACVRT
jgi:hypothetical protein